MKSKIWVVFVEMIVLDGSLSHDLLMMEEQIDLAEFVGELCWIQRKLNVYVFCGYWIFDQLILVMILLLV
jgi:hypothetical protein